MKLDDRAEALFANLMKAKEKAEAIDAEGGVILKEKDSLEKRAKQLQARRGMVMQEVARTTRAFVDYVETQQAVKVTIS